MLGVFNIRNDLWIELTKTRECIVVDSTFPDVSGLFLDWAPKGHHDFPKQAAIIEHYVKTGIPIIIYDRYLSLDKKEFKWLEKFNIHFWEPAISNRAEFEWVPQWTTGLKELDEDYVEREIDLAYSGSLNGKVASFEKYFKTYSGLFPDVKVAYNANLNKGKTRNYADYNLIKAKGLRYGDVSCTILIGSLNEYRIGYLQDDLFELMAAGVLPLMPLEHRFFGTVFKDFIVTSEVELDYYIKSYKNLKSVMIEEIWERLISTFPEFKISYVVEKINDYV